MSDSAGSEPNGELQQREQQARKTYHDKNVEFIRKMSERSRAVKQQMREQAEGRPPDFRLHLNGANKGAEQEAERRAADAAQAAPPRPGRPADEGHDEWGCVDATDSFLCSLEAGGGVTRTAERRSPSSEPPAVCYPTNVLAQGAQPRANEIELRAGPGAPDADDAHSQSGDASARDEGGCRPSGALCELRDESSDNFGSEAEEENGDQQQCGDSLRLVRAENGLFIPESLVNLMDTADVASGEGEDGPLGEDARGGHEDGERSPAPLCDGELVGGENGPLWSAGAQSQLEGNYFGTLDDEVRQSTIQPPKRAAPGGEAPKTNYPSNTGRRTVLAPKIPDGARCQGASGASAQADAPPRGEGGRAKPAGMVKGAEDRAGEGRPPRPLQAKKPAAKAVLGAASQAEPVPVRKIPQVLSQSNIFQSRGAQSTDSHVAELETLLMEYCSHYAAPGGDAIGIQLPGLMCNNKQISYYCFYQSLSDNQRTELITSRQTSLDALPTAQNRVYIVPLSYDPSACYSIQAQQARQGLAQVKDIIVSNVLIRCIRTDDLKKTLQGYIFQNTNKNELRIVNQTRIKLPPNVSPLEEDYEIRFKTDNTANGVLVQNKQQKTVDADASVHSCGNMVTIALVENYGDPHFLGLQEILFYNANKCIIRPKQVQSATDVSEMFVVEQKAVNDRLLELSCQITLYLDSVPARIGITNYKKEDYYKTKTIILTVCGHSEEIELGSQEEQQDFEICAATRKNTATSCLTERPEVIVQGTNASELFSLTRDTEISILLLENYSTAPGFSLHDILAVSTTNEAFSVLYANLEADDVGQHCKLCFWGSTATCNCQHMAASDRGNADLLQFTHNERDTLRFKKLILRLKFNITVEDSNERPLLSHLLYTASRRPDTLKRGYVFVDERPVSEATGVVFSPGFQRPQVIGVRKQTPKVVEQASKNPDVPIEQFIWEHILDTRCTGMFMRRYQLVHGVYVVESGMRGFVLQISVLSRWDMGAECSISSIRVLNTLREPVEGLVVSEERKPTMLEVSICSTDPMEFSLLEFQGRNCKTIALSIDRKLVLQGDLPNDNDITTISLTKGLKAVGCDRISFE